MTRILAPALMTLILLSGCSQAPVNTTDTEATPTACEDLANSPPADTLIASAAKVAAGAFQPPENSFEPFPTDYSGLPDFCRVTGSIHPTQDSDIRFELWLPTSGWNGRFMQTGNGGAAGAMFLFGMVQPLQLGYAVAHTDTGHVGGGGDFSWVTGHPERLVDFQYRSLGELTRVGKALTSAHFGKAPELSLFEGCSTGGRQGLTVAQIYPDDYDAIIAGAPANNWPALVSLAAVTEANIGSDKLPAQQLGLLKEAAIAACDADDGVADRVISSPDSCAFDPASLRCTQTRTSDCLDDAAVTVARKLYAGLVNDAGQTIYPGTGPGSEPTWAAFTSPGFKIGSNFIQHVVMQDPNWDPGSWDLERDLPRIRTATGPELAADDPDLSDFFGHGGRLLLYHGSTDGLIPFGNSVNYFQSVVETVDESATRDHLRLYLVPGMDHCAGGEGAWAVNWLGAMEAWIESGKPPGELPAAHPAEAFGPPGTPPGKPFTRPVCPWPQAASYRGEGDSNDAANFHCVQES